MTDMNELTLASILHQARDEGASIVTLRALVEEASALGAARALAQLGLSDATAGQDVREVRALLDAWRDAKRVARKAVIDWIVRLVLAGLLIAAAIKLHVLIPR
jgi:Family of unknown function (DUF6127)